MQTFLKGDTTAEMAIALAAGFDYTGKTVHLEYQGVRRSFADAVAGGVLKFSFSAEETAPMSLGAYPVRMWIEGADGSITSIHNSAVRLRVTDTPADVRGESAIYLDVRGGLYGIDGLPDRWNENDLHAKINEIIRRLGGTVAVFLLCALPAFAASLTVETAPKGAVYNDEAIVTNVTLDVSDLATKQDVADAVPADYDTVRAQVSTNAAAIAANATQIETKADAVKNEVTGDYWTIESRNGSLNGLTLTKDGSQSWGLDPVAYNLENMPSVLLTYGNGVWRYYDSVYVSTAHIEAPEDAVFLEATTGFSHYSNTVYLTRHVMTQTNTVVYSGQYDADRATIEDALANKVDRMKITKVLVDFAFYGMGKVPGETYHWRGADDVVEPVVSEEDPEFWDSRRMYWDLVWNDGIWTETVYWKYHSGRDEIAETNSVAGPLDMDRPLGYTRNPATEVWRDKVSTVVYNDSVDGILLSTITAIDEERLDTVGGIAEILISLKRQFEALKNKEEDE